MEKMISIIIAVDCILHGPFPLSEEIQKQFEERIVAISHLIPKSSVLNDYPKAIQFRGMIEKMKDDFEGSQIVYHIEKVIGTDDKD